MLRLLARSLVLALAVGVTLTPELALAIAAGDDCCAREGDSEEAPADEGCSPLCTDGCCPARTSEEPRPSLVLPAPAMAPLCTDAAPGRLRSGRFRDIEYPPGR